MQALPGRAPQSWRLGVLATAGGLLALAGHAELLRRYGTSLPYRDQWKCTAVDVLQPWLESRLGWKDFFAPLNDHWPVLTRALSFLLVQWNGEWNNAVETAANAVLFSAAVVLFIRCVLPALNGWAQPAFALLAGSIFALPITWENTLWGIQSLVYLQIALSFAYLASVAFERRFSAAWRWGHTAGLLVLLTQHSAVLVHIAAALVLAWRYWRQDGERRVALVGLGFAVVVIAMFAAFFPPLSATAALRADTWELALDVFLRQLAWPLPHPGWAFFVYLPWVLWAISRARARRMDPADAFIVACGLWVGAQALAIGYGRGADTYGFVSRYCDFLVVGWMLNAACLFRLWQDGHSRFIRRILVLSAAAWLAVPIPSFYFESAHGHTGHNLGRREDENRRNAARVRQYIATHDLSAFEGDGTRELYTYPPEITPLLREPRFVSLLPGEVRHTESALNKGRLEWLPRFLLASPASIAALGLLLVGRDLLQQRRSLTPRPLPEDEGTWNVEALLAAIAVLAGACCMVVSEWHSPLLVGRTGRLRAAYNPAGRNLVHAELAFKRVDGDHNERIDSVGAVETLPRDERPFWQGTRLVVEPDFRGILRSDAVRVERSFLVVPFTGYPCSDGNGMRWLLTNPETGDEVWLSYVGPNAGTNWEIWSTEVTRFKGYLASLVLFDGRDGPIGGWVGAANLVQTNERQFVERWRALMRLPRAEPTHQVVLWIGLAAVVTVVSGAAYRTRRRRVSLPVPPRPTPVCHPVG